jgi:hypothetical protein
MPVGHALHCAVQTDTLPPRDQRPNSIEETGIPSATLWPDVRLVRCSL